MLNWILVLLYLIIIYKAVLKLIKTIVEGIFFCGPYRDYQVNTVRQWMDFHPNLKAYFIYNLEEAENILEVSEKNCYFIEDPPIEKNQKLFKILIFLEKLKSFGLASKEKCKDFARESFKEKSYRILFWFFKMDGEYYVATFSDYFTMDAILKFLRSENEQKGFEDIKNNPLDDFWRQWGDIFV